MTDQPTRRPADTTGPDNTPPHPPSSAPTTHVAAVFPTPSEVWLRTELGDDAFVQLRAHRAQAGGALGELAALLWHATTEAVRLHRQLRRHAAQARDRYTEALSDSVHPGAWDVLVQAASIEQHSGHAATLTAARLSQQHQHLIDVLTAYRAATRPSP
ncbi:hypothetical protein [Streptomyces sp. NPDC050738]|uniref:hypothetical protein n=1 Tax=Streptomyces sp. NPDC050738 TaxID=3154744 RepID=UPI00343C90F1